MPFTDWTSARSSGSGMMKLDAKRPDDDVDQLLAAEAARGDGRRGVDRVAELGQESLLQFRQVGQQIAQDELGLRLEQRARRVRPYVVEGEGDEDPDPVRGVLDDGQ